MDIMRIAEEAKQAFEEAEGRKGITESEGKSASERLGKWEGGGLSLLPYFLRR